jgi:TonB family protein
VAATTPQEEKDRVTVANKKKKSSKKKSPPAKTPTTKTPTQKSLGKEAKPLGDTQGTKTGPVGGVGTSLDMGGFGPGSASGTSDFPYAWYRNLLYKRLWESWDKTDAGTQECSVSFIVQKDGVLDGVRINESSGNNFFDRLARQAVENAAPFPPLPEGYPEPQLHVHVRFRLQ